MSYQVLARRWRPKVFSELVGQEHVVRALSNALENNRLHHAFLFTGTRGVGKTTIARILAKSLNCEKGVSSEPCGRCSICQEVDDGRFIDLIEVDAASKTGVEDTRGLLENVPYAPVRGKFKVYLIDEVHMFSNHSFNALLKTLEEPPPHVKFLLATTDPQKVPITVLSRCLQFSLNRLSVKQIQSQFKLILDSEKIKYSEKALNVIAVAADGSMRDGLSILDQAIAFGGGEIREEEARKMLGINASEKLIDILRYIHFGDADNLLKEVDNISQKSPDFSGLLKDLLYLIHRISLLQATKSTWQENWGDRQNYEELCSLISPEDIQVYYQIGIIGQRDLSYAPDFQSGFEMTLLRMLTFRPVDSIDAKVVVEKLPQSSKSDSNSGSNETDMNNLDPKVNEKGPEISSQKPAFLSNKTNWYNVVDHLGLNGITKQLAENCNIEEIQENKLSLTVDENCSSMLDSIAPERLKEAICLHLNKKIDIEFNVGAVINTPSQKKREQEKDKQQQAEREIANDPLILAMQDTFDAEVIDDSIRPSETK